MLQRLLDRMSGENASVTATGRPVQASKAHAVTAHLARVVAELAPGALSDADLDKAALCYADWFAVAVAASHENAIAVLREYAAAEGGAPVASFLGTQMRGTVAQAALINGAASHFYDYDDVSQGWLGHPTVPVASAVWALAEREGVDGPSALTALIAGVEVSGRLGRALGLEHYRRGWHSSSTIGAIGAAAGCASLLRLDAQQTTIALGLAATRAAGLQVVFGTAAKPLQLAHAAQVGLNSAELARRGFTCATEALEGAGGFLALHGDGYDPAPLVAPPSSLLCIHDTVFKHHAACFGTHAPIEAAKTLRARTGFDCESIERIVLCASRETNAICRNPCPRTGLESKFSAPFAVALALTGHDTAALSTFSDEMTSVPQLQALAARVEMVADPSLEPTTAVLILRMKDGTAQSIAASSASTCGDPSRRPEEVRRKALALCRPVFGERAAHMIDSILDLRRGRLPDLRPGEASRSAGRAAQA
jgi:2-methylcitrate dehydratase PrpD